MATLTIDRRSGKTAGYNIQWREGTKRRTIHLGGKRYAKKTAERLKEIVEILLYYRRNCITVPDKSTEHWLNNASVEIRAKLAKVGLLVVTEQKTCQQLWDAFLNSKSDAKPASMLIYRNSQTKFFEAFLPTEPIEAITYERLLKWKAGLLERYAVASVATHIKTVGAVLNFAVDKKRKWLTDNPMEDIPIGSFVNRKNDRIVTMAEYAKLLASCPNQEWRTIIALARIGGLRCPSELQQLRWSDIDWLKNRFTVRSPKTERHEHCRERIVPLFAELRKELKRHFSIDGTESNEFVIQGLQGTDWMLYMPFQKIASNAGLGDIKRPFDNMRTSRSNEIRRRWGETKESLWIGHTKEISKKHYLDLDDEEFAEAAE